LPKSHRVRAWKNVDLPTLGRPTIPDYRKIPSAYIGKTKGRGQKEENDWERDSIVGDAVFEGWLL